MAQQYFKHSGRRHRVLGLILLVPLLSACSLSRFAQVEEKSFDEISCAPPDTASTNIYVDSLGWHTGIILARNDAQDDLGEIIPELKQSAWVEIGWGDRDFYMASGYSYWTGLRAIFFSQGSAVHAVGFNDSPESFFEHYQLFRISIERAKLKELLAYIRHHVALNACGESERLGDGLYGKGSFYAGCGSFSITHTCNSWTADALARAGCKIDPHITRSSSLINELRKLRVPR